MADCYYHGYSGGPGSCTYCEEETRRGLEPGTLDGYVGMFTMKDASVSSLGRGLHAHLHGSGQEGDSTSQAPETSKQEGGKPSAAAETAKKKKKKKKKKKNNQR